MGCFKTCGTDLTAKEEVLAGVTGPAPCLAAGWLCDARGLTCLQSNKCMFTIYFQFDTLPYGH